MSNKNPNQIKIIISGPRGSEISETAFRLSAFLATSMRVDRGGLLACPKVVNTEVLYTPKLEAEADFVITTTSQPVVFAAERDIALQRAEEYLAQAQRLQKEVDRLKAELGKTKDEYEAFRTETQARIKKVEEIQIGDRVVLPNGKVGRVVAAPRLYATVNGFDDEKTLYTGYEISELRLYCPCESVRACPEVKVGTFVKKRFGSGAVGRVEAISHDGKKVVVDWSGSFGFGTVDVADLTLWDEN